MNIYTVIRRNHGAAFLEGATDEQQEIAKELIKEISVIVRDKLVEKSMTDFGWAILYVAQYEAFHMLNEVSCKGEIK